MKINTKNIKNIRRTLKAHVAEQIQLTEIQNRMCPAQRDFPQQKLQSSIKALSSCRYMKRHFLGSFKMHTCLLDARTDCTWSHSTLSCVLIIMIQYQIQDVYVNYYQNKKTYLCFCKIAATRQLHFCKKAPVSSIEVSSQVTSAPF